MTEAEKMHTVIDHAARELCDVIVSYHAFGCDDVFSFTTIYGEDILERVFGLLNWGSGREDAYILGSKRSLSVGDDVGIKINGHTTTWRCESVGWKRIERTCE